jgi:hypothetical protein
MPSVVSMVDENTAFIFISQKLADDETYDTECCDDAAQICSSTFFAVFIARHFVRHSNRPL